MPGSSGNTTETLSVCFVSLPKAFPVYEPANRHAAYLLTTL